MKKDKNIKRKKSPSKVFKKILLTILIIILIAFAGASGIAIAMIKNAPSLDVDAILALDEDSMIYDSNGNFMDYVPTVEKRSIVSLDEMSPYLKKAVVNIEDERFYEHNGIDVKRIFGALYTDIKNKITGNSSLHGASTLTQQLLKNTILTNEVTITRKVQEMYLAIKLEQVLSKDQILEAYLNTIALGGRAYGVEAASIQYFGKHAKDLNLIESAYIVGVTQNPARYYAFSTSAKQDPSPYINRTKTVIGKMYENGAISKEEYDNAIAEIDTNGITFNQQTTDSNKLNYEWFSVPVMTSVKEGLKEKYGYTDDEVERMLCYGGLSIYTTMDRSIQDYSQNEVFDKASAFLNIPASTSDGSIVQPQMGAAVMDYKTGEVKALIGGRGSHPPMSYNRAASTKYLRNSGSSIKPLTVYSPLIDLKIATAGTTIDDSPLSDALLKRYGYSEQPNNVDRIYRGYTTLREAVRQSVNVVAIKGEDLLGLSNGLAYGEKYGIKFNTVSRNNMSTLALGQFDNSSSDLDGVNPLTMAAAYGTFGNGGTYTKPILFTKVEDRDGNIILESEITHTQVISPQAAFIMYDILKGPVSYTGTNAKFGSIPVSGKTGSSTDFKDLWFSGLTPYYSAAVWIGNDIPQNLSKTYGLNSNSAALIWGKIMAKVHEGLDYKEIEKPDGVVSEEICSVSGKLATSACHNDPRGDKTYTEYFIDGTVPTALCDAHVTAKVNSQNGKLANDKTPSELIVDRVFLSSQYASGDQSYAVPTEEDDTEPVPEETPEQETPDNSPENTEENAPGSNNGNATPGNGNNNNSNKH